MALDKLPDPLPLRHSKQWGGRAVRRQRDAYIGLHPFLLDEVMAALIRTALSMRPPACRVLCPELTAAWAQRNTPTFKSQWWENNQAKILSAVWHKEPSPPSAESYRFAVPVCGPVCNLFRLGQTRDCSNSLKQVYPESTNKWWFCCCLGFFFLIICGFFAFWGVVCLFASLFLIVMSQKLDPRQDCKGKLLVLHPL